MSVFVCPNCKSELTEYEKSFICRNGHSFDKAKQGYVNLSLTQKSSKKRHGDDRLMVAARAGFLSAGFYAPLVDGLNKTVSVLLPENGVILDCGCGEGYYTNGMYEFLLGGNKKFDIYGADISKDAVVAACRRNRQIGYCVSSVAQLPVKSGSVDIITSIFAPYSDSEFYRVLKDDGILIRVIPLEKHLYSLKAAVYGKPYENIPDLPQLTGFSLSGRTDIKYSFTAEKEQISNLFMMTPYYYKTSADDQKKLESVQRLTTEAEFAILIYKKV